MISSRFDKDRFVMVHTATEELTVEEIVTATRLWFSHTSFNPKRAVVWHIEEATLQMTLDELGAIYDRVRQSVKEKRSGGKTAWVHSSAMVRSMIDIVSAEFDWGSEWRTFSTLAEALRWCDEAAEAPPQR